MFVTCSVIRLVTQSLEGQQTLCYEIVGIISECSATRSLSSFNGIFCPQLYSVSLFYHDLVRRNNLFFINR